jgi:Dynamin family
LLGRNVLPADILPTTATLNRVVYGLRPAVSIFKDGRSEEIEIDQLSDYVTKFTSESRQVAASIAEAVVSYPVPYLRNNVEIYDTPGLNDEESMTAVTDSVVPSVDAAILVIIPQSPFPVRGGLPRTQVTDQRPGQGDLRRQSHRYPGRTG